MTCHSIHHRLADFHPRCSSLHYRKRSYNLCQSEHRCQKDRPCKIRHPCRHPYKYDRNHTYYSGRFPNRSASAPSGCRNKRRSCNRSGCYVYPNQHVLFLCTRTIVRTSLCYAGYGKKDCSRAFQHDRNGRKDPCCYVLSTCPRIPGCSDHRTYHLGCLHTDAYHYVCRKACG